MTKQQSKILRLQNWAFKLSLITIGYNLVEGGVSVFFGAEDETLALFGFGVDSFVEIISGLGIAHMLWRTRISPAQESDRFERAALKVTGTAFYILVFGLVIGSGLNIYLQVAPQTTRVGVVVAVLSIFTMYFLYREKLKVGRKLNSSPIISDANCTKTCFYLSFILLGSSLLYEVFKIGYIDALGSLGIAWYALKEGREAFKKARTGQMSCTDDCC